MCLVCAGARDARAQDGPAVTGVRVRQEGRLVTDAVVLGLIDTHVGRPLSVREVRDTIAHLTSLGQFEDIRVYRDPTPGGATLRWELVPLHPVDRVEFRGDLGLDVNELRRIVSDRFGPVPAAPRAEEVAMAVGVAYRTRGYPDARVTPRIEETHAPDRASMVFDVVAGRRVVIRELRVLQVDTEGAPTVTARPAIAEGDVYDEQAILRALGRWESDLRGQGYYEARASHGASFLDVGAVLNVNLSRGPRVVVQFFGDPVPQSDQDRLVPIRTEGSVDEDLLEDAARNIERDLRARGYRDAEVEFARQERGTDLFVTFTVRRGPRYVVSGLVITGNASIPGSELEALRVMKPNEPFVQARLDDVLVAVERLYRSRGFTRVQITAAPVQVRGTGLDDRAIEARLTVVEGPRTLVRALAFMGHVAMSAAQLASIAAVAPGQAFSVGQVASARDAILRAYRDNGYDSVSVGVEWTLAENDTRADLRIDVREGPQVIVDHVIIVGNQRIGAAAISRELLVKPRQPLGETMLTETRARLAALGLFRRIQIETIEHGSEPRRDVLVRVEEAPPTTWGVGGGLESGFRLRPAADGGQAEERLEFAPRGFFQIRRRNLWGKNREATLFTRASLRSRDLSNTAGNRPQSNYGFNEYRVVGTFREPRAFETAAVVLVTGIFEQAIRSSFNFVRREVRAEAVTRLSRAYSATGRYSFQSIRLLDERFTPSEQPLIDRLFPEVRLSRFAGSVIRDTRDNPLDATRGTFLIADADVAARAIGSEVGFVKSYVQASSFHRLPSGRRAVVANAVRLGLAHGFARELDGVLVQDLPASERFFAGGDASVRGFSLDRLGNADTIGPNGFPTGGNGVIVLLNELRFALFGSWEGVGFFDAGNVFPRAADLRLADLRSSAGAGVRYRSPFGPIRFDWGFNLDPRELVPGVRERGSVWHFSLGQAF